MVEHCPHCGARYSGPGIIQRWRGTEVLVKFCDACKLSFIIVPGERLFQDRAVDLAGALEGYNLGRLLLLDKAIRFSIQTWGLLFSIPLGLSLVQALHALRKEFNVHDN